MVLHTKGHYGPAYKALGDTLQHRLDGSDGQAQTDGGTRAAVAADRDRLA